VLGNGSVLIAHPSADRYGSDLQLLETVSALTTAGTQVTVVLPVDGPLVELLRQRGASVRLVPFPVLRKAAMRPRGFVILLGQLLRRLPRVVMTVWSGGASIVVVNTVTIPWWLLAGRIARRRTVCHVHEAEDSGPRLALRMLGLPILLAQQVVVNSHASAKTLTDVTPRVRDRVQVVYNGVLLLRLAPTRAGRSASSWWAACRSAKGPTWPWRPLHVSARTAATSGSCCVAPRSRATSGSSGS
jgi:hypothetical protein